MLIEVRIRTVGKDGSQTLSTCRGVDRREYLRQRPRSPAPAQRQHLPALQQQLNGAAKTGPELYLPGNRALNGIANQAGIQDERVGEFDRLAHAIHPGS